MQVQSSKINQHYVVKPRFILVQPRLQPRPSIVKRVATWARSWFQKLAPLPLVATGTLISLSCNWPATFMLSTMQPISFISTFVLERLQSNRDMPLTERFPLNKHIMYPIVGAILGKIPQMIAAYPTLTEGEATKFIFLGIIPSGKMGCIATLLSGLALMFFNLIHTQMVWARKFVIAQQITRQKEAHNL